MDWRQWPVALALTTLSAAGCNDTRAAPAGLAAPLRGTGERGIYAFDLTLRPDPPAVGAFFEILTRVRDAHTGEVVAGAILDLDAIMTAHGHGMTSAPEHSEIERGVYRSEGMKLHMPGRWTFVVRARRGAAEDRLTLAYDEPPRARR